MRGEVGFPALAEIVPGELVVRVYFHEQATLNGRERCWSFVSDGLRARRQKEVVFTLRLEPGEKPEGFPREVFFFFELIHELAAHGRSVDAGGTTDFGERGFLGRRAIAYTDAIAFGGVVPSSPSLSAILLTEGEFAAYPAIGLSRILTLLGKAYSHFPCPPWSDRRRPSVVTQGLLRTSLLARTPALNPGSAVASREEGVLTLRLPQGARTRLASGLEPLADGGMFAILADLDPGADGCLVWTPGETQPAAISRTNARPSRMAGCFLAAAPVAGAESDRSEPCEDGFLLSLTPASYRALREALKRGSALALPASPDRFRLEWDAAPAPKVERALKVPARKPEGGPIPLESMTRNRDSGRGAAAAK